MRDPEPLTPEEEDALVAELRDLFAGEELTKGVCDNCGETIGSCEC